MYNISIRKWLKELEREIEVLQQDYIMLEDKEAESMRHEVLKDIRSIRTILNTISQKVKDLNWVRKDK